APREKPFPRRCPHVASNRLLERLTQHGVGCLRTQQRLNAAPRRLGNAGRPALASVWFVRLPVSCFPFHCRVAAYSVARPCCAARGFSRGKTTFVQCFCHATSGVEESRRSCSPIQLRQLRQELGVLRRPLPMRRRPPERHRVSPYRAFPSSTGSLGFLM